MIHQKNKTCSIFHPEQFRLGINATDWKQKALDVALFAQDHSSPHINFFFLISSLSVC